jgi:carbon-monoxide dehydrogenase medium subunit
MTTHAEVARSAAIKAAIPALATLAGLIGDPQVRHRGTIGGSIANADPASDYPAAVLGLAATIITDRREVAADEFFQAMFQTALEPDELITAIRFPIPDAAGYAKFKSQASRFAIACGSPSPARRRWCFAPRTWRMRWRRTSPPVRWRGSRLRHPD